MAPSGTNLGALRNLSETRVLQANQFPINTVKLVQNSCTAEITRTFPLSFLRVQDEPQMVVIVHLPACIQSVDLSVASKSGNVTILDHYLTRAADLQTSTSMLRELEGERLRLEDEKRFRQQGLTLLTTYMESLAKCKSETQTEAAQMVSFFDECVDIGITRSASVAELDVELGDVENEIEEETDRLFKLKRKLPVEVAILFSCKGKVPADAAELIVTYVVNQVSWQPVYDLHVGMTGNTPSQAVTLDFRYSVSQWTGEDWENISLALATADQMSQSTHLPELKKINISHHPTGMTAFPYPEVAYQPSYLGPAPAIPLGMWNGPLQYPAWGPEYPRLDGPPVRAAKSHRETSDHNHNRRVVRKEELVAQPMAPEHVTSPSLAVEVADDCRTDDSSQTIVDLISCDSKDPITHVASGCVFIPSGHATHHVLVASLSLQAEFMHVVVPSIDTRVYYTCEVKITNDYVLLPGTVKVYLNDKHVSSTMTYNTELPQILDCLVSVDTGLKITHSRVPDTTRSVIMFTGKARTTYTTETVLQNTQADPIRGVIVRSAIPVSMDPRTTVVLKEPAGLADINEGSVVVRDGCLARWSTTGGREGKQAGLFEWVCDVNPGTEVLKTVWEVREPRAKARLPKAFHGQMTCCKWCVRP